MPTLLALYGLGLLPLCVVVARAVRVEAVAPSPRAGRRRVLLVVLLWAFLLRLPLLLVGPSLSDDLYRYTGEV